MPEKWERDILIPYIGQFVGYISKALKYVQLKMN